MAQFYKVTSPVDSYAKRWKLGAQDNQVVYASSPSNARKMAITFTGVPSAALKLDLLPFETLPVGYNRLGIPAPIKDSQGRTINTAEIEMAKRDQRDALARMGLPPVMEERGLDIGPLRAPEDIPTVNIPEFDPLSNFKGETPTGSAVPGMGPMSGRVPDWEDEFSMLHEGSDMYAFDPNVQAKLAYETAPY